MNEYTGVARQLVSHDDAKALRIEQSIENYLDPFWPWPSMKAFYMGFTPGRIANLLGDKYKVTCIQAEFLIEPIEG